MIRVMALYPKGENTNFNMEYWQTKHMPMLTEMWPGVRWEADACNADSPYYAVAHMMFDSMDAMGAALGGPNTGTVMADVANYTNVQPVMSINEIAVSSS